MPAAKRSSSRADASVSPAKPAASAAERGRVAGGATSASRKGATSRALVGAELRAKLERGELETKTLSETLAIDFRRLLEAVALDASPLVETSIVKRMAEAAARIPAWEQYASHPSDTVRGWAAYRLAAEPRMAFAEKLRCMRRFAVDHHFGVREWAWLALRPAIAANLDEALSLLTAFAGDPDAYARRFASESTRPRGVWCAHLEVLKREPGRGLFLLEPLRADASKYVRDSVANWLNDASKTSPAWVTKTTARWLVESPGPETQSLVRRARRSLA